MGFGWLGALPFFLVLGIAVQSPATYLLLVVVPGILVLGRNGRLDPSAPGLFLRLGTALLGLYAVFPVANILSWAFVHRHTPLLRSLGSSRFSSCYLILGLALLGAGWWLRSQGTRRQWSMGTEARNQLPGVFVRSLGWAAILLLGYGLVQNWTGFDYRGPDHHLAPEHQVPGGAYRVFGFFGHPLTMASVGLHGMAILWAWAQTRALPYRALAACGALAFFLLVVLSGGRVALAIAFVELAAVSLCSGGVRSCLWTLLGCFPLGLLLFLSHFAERAIQTMDQAANLGDRLTFWKVHWNLFAEHPLLGHGAAFLDGGVRTDRYVSLGYGDLVDKFNAHNLFLEILACTGVIGAASLCAHLWTGLREVNRLARRSDHARTLFLGCCMGLASNLLHGLTQNTFFDASVSVFTLASFGAVVWACVWPGEDTVSTFA